MKSLFASLFFTQLVYGQAWVQLSDFPGTKRDDGIAVAVNNKAYFGTGLQEWNATNDFRVLDLTTYGWSIIPTLPATKERQYACAFTGNDCFYVFGGDGVGGALSDVFKFEVNTMVWTSLSSKPGNGLIGASCMNFGDKVIIAGGKFQNGKVSNEVWEYSLSTDSWQQKNNLPFAGRWRSSATVLGNTGYLIFGRDTGGSYRKELYNYQPANEQWTKITDFPQGAGRSYAALHTAKNKLILFGGIDTMGTYYNDIWYFDPLTTVWLQGPDLPAPGRKGGLSCSNGDIFLYSCGLGTGEQRLTETWMTDVPVAIQENNLSQSFAVYPNPGKDRIWIQFSEQHTQNKSIYYTLSDLCGKELVTKKLLSQNEELDLSSLKEGLYLLAFFLEERLIEVKKVVKN